MLAELERSLPIPFTIRLAPSESGERPLNGNTETQTFV